MEKPTVEQLVIQELRRQRIEADDRGANQGVELLQAKLKIAELEEELKNLKEPKGT